MNVHAVKQFERRIQLLENTNRNLEKDLKSVHPVLGMTAKGKRKSSIQGAIWANENEIKSIRRRLESAQLNIAR